MNTSLIRLFILITIITIPIFLIIHEKLPSRSIQSSEKIENFGQLIEYIDARQTLPGYTAVYIKAVGGMQTYHYDSYSLNIVDEYVQEGFRNVTATTIRAKLKEDISNWTKNQKEELIKISFGSTHCFRNDFVACFDEKRDLVYYALYGFDYVSWRIPSEFNISEESIKEELYEARMNQIREYKLKNCTNELCRKFFSLLNDSPEYKYEIQQEYKIIPYDGWTSNYSYILEYSVENESIISEKGLEDIGGYYTETELKTELSNLDLNLCKYLYFEKDNEVCFKFYGSEYPCEIYFNKDRKSCTYCFSAEGYLNSIDCSGNGYNRWFKK